MMAGAPGEQGVPGDGPRSACPPSASCVASSSRTGPERRGKPVGATGAPSSSATVAEARGSVPNCPTWPGHEEVLSSGDRTGEGVLAESDAQEAIFWGTYWFGRHVSGKVEV